MEAYSNNSTYYSSSNSMRKPQTKAKKAPVAPPPPTPVKVYNVHPMNFRDLVQELTGAPEFKPHQNPLLSSSSSSSRDVNIAAAASTTTANWYMGGSDIKHWNS
ncbi:hypothetical protein PIB30_030656 [Stylosanthes scabra]|uniref:VQ domain-containing protein n=1 Tax=Stylosanthes scabra TaxID=79078 RepID=A0ABU6Z9A6_9FABA|nr:hypothetical protein [Stylosanthes scabra]